MNKTQQLKQQQTPKMKNTQSLIMSVITDWYNGVLQHFQQYFSHFTVTAHIIQVFLVFY